MSERFISLQEMKEVLPCKKDFLLLDRVQMIGENKIIGFKCVTVDEAFFMGHFAGHPIMPGVLQVEAVAQLAELAVWKKLDPERKNDIYIKELRKVKFRHPNNPGDRIRIEAEILSCDSESAKISAVVYNNSGAASQVEMVLSVRAKEWDLTIPEYNQYDKSESCQWDVTRIMGYIPHRYPFLFVDHVVKVEGSHLTGVKNAMNTEAIFREYDDGYMVMTGSVHPEIVAQAGCIYMLSNEINHGKIAYFMGIDHSEFFGAVHPGDQMRLEVDIPNCSKRFGTGEGCMYVNDKLISKTNMTFAIVDP